MEKAPGTLSKGSQEPALRKQKDSITLSWLEANALMAKLSSQKGQYGKMSFQAPLTIFQNTSMQYFKRCIRLASFMHSKYARSYGRCQHPVGNAACAKDSTFHCSKDGDDSQSIYICKHDTFYALTERLT